MSRKENIEKNMEFLIKELQKEWDVSKETKHRVTISVKDARSIRIRVQQQIADMGEMLHNQSDIEDVKDMLKHTMRIENSEYGIRTLDVDSFLIFLCIHHYREATMLLKILEGEDLTLYKYLDIHVFIKQTSIDWAKLISKAKLYDKEIEVYHTLWYTEHIYPGTIPNSVFSMFELKDYDFVDEYNVKDNSHERIKWKLDFYHRLFNVERRKEALEAAKDESEKLKKMITDLRD